MFPVQGIQPERLNVISLAYYWLFLIYVSTFSSNYKTKQCVKNYTKISFIILQKGFLNLSEFKSSQVRHETKKKFLIYVKTKSRRLQKVFQEIIPQSRYCGKNSNVKNGQRFTSSKCRLTLALISTHTRGICSGSASYLVSQTLKQKIDKLIELLTILYKRLDEIYSIDCLKSSLQ